MAMMFFLPLEISPRDGFPQYNFIDVLLHRQKTT